MSQEALEEKAREIYELQTMLDKARHEYREMQDRWVIRSGIARLLRLCPDDTFKDVVKGITQVRKRACGIEIVYGGHTQTYIIRAVPLSATLPSGNACYVENPLLHHVIKDDEVVRPDPRDPYTQKKPHTEVVEKAHIFLWIWNMRKYLKE